MAGKLDLYSVLLASFPVPRPAFRRLQYCKQRKAGRGPGNEASQPIYK